MSVNGTSAGPSREYVPIEGLAPAARALWSQRNTDSEPVTLTWHPRSDLPAPEQSAPPERRATSTAAQDAHLRAARTSTHLDATPVHVQPHVGRPLQGLPEPERHLPDPSAARG
jgi:hypothetical protein